MGKNHLLSPKTTSPHFPATPSEQLQEIKRGIAELLPEDEFLKKLESSYVQKKPLIVKLGLDPSRPDIHLGHLVVIQKLKLLQELGHEIHFLIGDFTARIGDPTGRNKTRPVMTEEEILANAKTYQDQVFKVLNPEKTRVDFNSTWLKKIDLAYFLQILMTTSLVQILAREDFSKRFQEEQPLFLHELMYPLLQGYDSVAMKADLELGGTDQKFNLLMGRHLQKIFQQSQQAVLMMPLLEGLDGTQKMSKSLNNYIALTDPPSEMFGKIMSISDPLMLRYYQLLSSCSIQDLEAIRLGQVHPMEAKKRLGVEVVGFFHSIETARKSREEFEARFSKKASSQPVTEADYPALELICDEKGGVHWVEWLVKQGLVASKSEVRRLIQQKAIRWEGAICEHEWMSLASVSKGVLRVGKLKSFRLQIQSRR